MTEGSESAPRGVGIEVGAELHLEIGPVAHGGHCVARHEGQVVFVRHSLPGERVVARVTSKTSKFLRADAVEVVQAAEGRVAARCPHARPGACGGCDWQHADLPTQRQLKAAVVSEQLRRLAGIEREVLVEEVPGAPDGLGWRTRERFTVDPASGRPGLHRHRSSEVLPLEDCPLAHPGVLATGVLARTWPGVESIQVAVSPTTGDTAVVVDGAAQGARRVRERVGGHDFRVAADGFWQVHPGAAETLTAAVVEALAALPGEHAVDLYSGAGLYAAALGDAVGVTGRVDAVEGSGLAVRDARRNLHDLPWVSLHEGDVGRWLATGGVRRCDVLVLDPPRAGAGADVVRRIARLARRAVAYVACDPASLARDLRTFAELGWELQSFRAFDLFPMTHHVECLALLQPLADQADPVIS